ncbi:endonuclease domain-containing protein [Streptomyces microflavus]|uniref:endonuclease domain-containing protein n=1 Tax=Streptomyces microflavus TaxID=1919 RepID=UPI00367D8755
MGRKQCTSCDAWLSPERFSRRVASEDGLSPSCRRCQRDRQLKRCFGITLARYESILAGQGGGCAVCGKPEEANGKMLAVDHDHTCCPDRLTCGACVRGLLCSGCNLHLGAIGDRVDHLEAMVAYLRGAT